MTEVNHDSFFKEQEKKLSTEHKTTTMRTMLNQYYEINYTSGEKMQKNLHYYKLINPQENYFHIAFIAYDVNKADIDFCKEMIKEELSKPGGLPIAGLYPVMYWNETPGKELDLSGKVQPERNINALRFSNRVYLYTNELPEGYYDKINNEFKLNGLIPSIRDTKTWNTMEQNRKPDVFICHDSRDKAEAAKPLYEALISRGLKVWYDEVSLELGDSLTEKIEEGIRQCRFGLIILSKNFLSNDRWAKNELQSFGTKQRITNEKVVIPIWHGIDESDLAQYSYWLLDKKGGSTSNIDVLADQIKNIVNK
jgi:hypothetical protein